MKHTKISWADSTWNPWWGCTKVSPGCANCYAWSQTHHFNQCEWGDKAERLRQDAKYWRQPLRWDAEAAKGKVGKDGKHWIVFAGDMCDIFDAHGLPDERDRMWQLFRATPHLTWLLLTKRPKNFKKYLPADWGEGYANVWLGVTVEDRKHGYPRVDILRTTPAKVKFLSCEPLLEDISTINLTGIDWVITGGESGGNARTFNADWARLLRDKCKKDNVAFFYKQNGSKALSGDFVITNSVRWPADKDHANPYRDVQGKNPENFPADLRVREWPHAGAKTPASRGGAHPLPHYAKP